MAIAGRIGVELDLEDFDKFSRDVPLVANLQPSGAYFMEDLYYAGGLPAVMHAIERYLHTDVLTVNGQTLGENISGCESLDPTVISTVEEPINALSGMVVLRGNL